MKSSSRSAARLAAVQALYQEEMEGTKLPLLLREFHMHRLGAEIEDAQYNEAEIDFFNRIVAGVYETREEIDNLLESKLAKGWSIPRLDLTMLQILRAAIYELQEEKDIAVGTIINEYLDVAHAFFDQKHVNFANGLLDAIAKDVRK